jgi:hypothetical protein
MAGNGAGDDGGGSVGVRVGQRQIGLIGVVIVAAATAGIGVERRRVMLKGVRVVIGAGMMDRRTSFRRLGRHGCGVAGRIRWRIEQKRACGQPGVNVPYFFLLGCSVCLQCMSRRMIYTFFH